jgi:TolB-like protein
VLPFSNLSGDKENEYFSDGLAEDILNALVKVPGLLVTARTSTLAFVGKGQDIRSIAQGLNVEYILEGSVRKLGSRLRVTAQLIKASDGYHLWSERYDREMTDVFAIQDEISQAIVETLKLKLSGQPLLNRPTADLEAYNLYLRGRHLSAGSTLGAFGSPGSTSSRRSHATPSTRSHTLGWDTCWSSKPCGGELLLAVFCRTRNGLWRKLWSWMGVSRLHMPTWAACWDTTTTIGQEPSVR